MALARAESGAVVTAGELTGIIGASVALLVALFGFIRALRSQRTEDKKADVELLQADFGANLELNRYIDQRVKEQVADRMGPVNQRLEHAESKAGALSRIVRALARQWPGPGEPDLNPDDIAIVEESIPQHWIRRGGDPERT